MSLATYANFPLFRCSKNKKMRYLLTQLFLVCTLIASAEGNGGCGTVAPVNLHFNIPASERLSGVAIHNRAGVRYVPVAYHVVQRSNGTGGITLKSLFETHCEL